MEQGEDSEELTQRVSHVLLHHLPPDAQTDESHQAERLQADDDARLHATGEPAQSRSGDRSNGGDFRLHRGLNKKKQRKKIHCKSYQKSAR